jgi:hypothetical protein
MAHKRPIPSGNPPAPLNRKRPQFFPRLNIRLRPSRFPGVSIRIFPENAEGVQNPLRLKARHFGAFCNDENSQSPLSN